MRITNNSALIPYKRNLDNIQNKRLKEQMKISTGTKIQELSDAPKEIVDIKLLQNRIDSNKKYMTVLNNTKSELLSAEGQLLNMSDILTDIRQLGIQATETGNVGNVNSIAVYVKGLMEDMITAANGDHNGKYLFSGTKTTANSLDTTPEGQNNKPFELVEGTATTDNPSGLTIVFKGNFEDRVINKDKYSQETVNQTADGLFGAGGKELFEKLIDMYNVLAYNANGVKRDTEDLFDRFDMQKLNEFQQDFADYIEMIDTKAGESGSIFNRLESIEQQMKQENTRFEDLLSVNKDTDIAEATIELAKQENALSYALQAGSKIMSNTLFDFLR